MAARILMAIEDQNVAASLEKTLVAEGYEVETPGESETLERAMRGGFDVIVLSESGPTHRGVKLCSALRQSGVMRPILLLSLGRFFDRILGLRAGADDCIAFDAGPAEFLARLHALVRRAQWDAPAVKPLFRFGGVSVDLDSGAVSRRGRPVYISATEMRLLRYLIHRANQIVSKVEMMRDVWGYQSSETRTVEMHIAALRKKLEDNPGEPRYFITIRGKGYLLWVG